jgi:hypothetical protein
MPAKGWPVCRESGGLLSCAGDPVWFDVLKSGVGAREGVFIAPADENGIAKPQDDWITVSEHPGPNSRPWWSSDGNVIYYLLTRGSQASIWARRLNPTTKQPLGEAFIIYSPPVLRTLVLGHPFGPTMGARQLIFAMSETTGNIWLAE